MAPRDHKKSDYHSKENHSKQSNLIGNEHISNLKPTVPSINIAAASPLKPVINVLEAPQGEWGQQLKSPSHKKQQVEWETKSNDKTLDTEISVQEEKVVLQYEELFPALGDETAHKSAEKEFNPEILAPETIVNAIIHDEQVLNNSTMLTEEVEKMEISREVAKDIVQEAVVHTLEENLIPRNLETDLKDEQVEVRSHSFFATEELAPKDVNQGSLNREPEQEENSFVLTLPASDFVTINHDEQKEFILSLPAHTFVAPEDRKENTFVLSLPAHTFVAPEDRKENTFVLELPGSTFVAPADEKAVEYENQFPTLGEEPVVKTDHKFDTSILSEKVVAEHAQIAVTDAPINPIPYLAHQKAPEPVIVHKVAAPASAGEWGTGVHKPMQKKVHEYENQFPALGEEASHIKAEAHEEFDPTYNPELLSPKHIAKVAEKVVHEAAVNPIPYLAHEKLVLPLDRSVHKEAVHEDNGEWAKHSLPKSPRKGDISTNWSVIKNASPERSHVGYEVIQPSNITSDDVIRTVEEPVKINIETIEETQSLLNKDTKPMVYNTVKVTIGSNDEVHRATEEVTQAIVIDTVKVTIDSNDQVQRVVVEEVIIPSQETISTAVPTVIDVEAKERDSFYREMEMNLLKAKDLEKANMFGAAINVLKKSVSALQSFTAKHAYNKATTDRLFIECNVELSHLYTIVREYPLANSFAQAALDIDHTNPRVIYLLGTGLINAGHKAEGYNVLLEGTRLPKTAGVRDPFFGLIEQELAKFELKTDIQTGHVKPEVVIPIMGTTAGLSAEDVEANIKMARRAGMTTTATTGMTVASSAGVFVGTGAATGLATWFLSKEQYNLSDKKALAYAVGAGAVIGGVSLLVYSHMRKAKTESK